MSKASRSVRVEAIPGEVCRYRVESWGESQVPYVVDLLERDGASECTCKDYRTRCMKNYRENGGIIIPYGSPGNPDPKRVHCKHIYCARTKFLNDLLRDMAKTQKEK